MNDHNKFKMYQLHLVIFKQLHLVKNELTFYCVLAYN